MRCNETTIEMAKKIRALRAAEPLGDNGDKLRDINHWLIPCAVLGTLSLWITAAIVLTGGHDKPATGGTLLLVTAAAVATATTVLYINDHLRQRSMSRNHQVILGALTMLRQEMTALDEMSERLKALEDASWEDAAEQLRAVVTGDASGTSQAHVVPLAPGAATTRRPAPRYRPGG